MQYLVEGQTVIGTVRTSYHGIVSEADVLYGNVVIREGKTTHLDPSQYEKLLKKFLLSDAGKDYAIRPGRPKKKKRRIPDPGENYFRESEQVSEVRQPVSSVTQEESPKQEQVPAIPVPEASPVSSKDTEQEADHPIDDLTPENKSGSPLQENPEQHPPVLTNRREGFSSSLRSMLCDHVTESSDSSVSHAETETDTAPFPAETEQVSRSAECVSDETEEISEEAEHEPEDPKQAEEIQKEISAKKEVSGEQVIHQNDSADYKNIPREKSSRETKSLSQLKTRINILRFMMVLSITASVFLLMCLFNIIPLNPAGDGRHFAVRVTRDIERGSMITADDLESAELSASQYEDLSGEQYITSSGKAGVGTGVLWDNRNDIIGCYAVKSLRAGDYVTTADYSELSEGESVIEMDVDGTKVHVPVTAVEDGQSDVRLYAIVTTSEGEEKHSVAINLGTLKLEGRSLQDVLNEDGTSVLEKIVQN